MIPAPYRILALVLLLLAGIAAGVVAGLTIESNLRDAQDLRQERADRAAFAVALAAGKRHAANVIAWKRKAQDYYQQQKETQDHVTDSQLAHCQTTDGSGAKPSGVHAAALLSGTWVGLYNAYWLPGFDAAGDPGRADAEVTAAGAVTPREALDNVSINAHRCAEDRKRHDELIDHLMEVGAQ